jgi:hypothetical protein
VAELPGHAVLAFQQLAIHHNAAAAPRADDQPEHDAAPGRRAVRGLGEGEAIRIVGDAHFAPQQRAEILVERMAVQRVGIGVLHQPGGRRDAARYAHAHGGAHPGLGLGLAHQSGHHLQRGAVASGGWRAAAQQLLALRVQQEDFGFRAAEVDANTIGHARLVG